MNDQPDRNTELAGMSLADYKAATRTAPVEAPADESTHEEQPGSEPAKVKSEEAAESGAEGEKSENPAEPAEEPEADEKDLPRGVQKALAKKTFKLRQAEQQRDEARAELQKLRDGHPQQEPTVDLSKEPDLADFDYDEPRFKEALKAHTLAAEKAKEVEAKQREAEQAEGRAIAEKVKAAKKEFADFEAVAMDPAVLSAISKMPVLAQAITDSESFGKLAYHLGNNPEVLESLVAMPPLQALKALWKIENELSSPPPPKTPASSLPKPFKAVGGGGVTKTELTREDLASMSFPEYKRRRLLSRQ